MPSGESWKARIGSGMDCLRKYSPIRTLMIFGDVGRSLSLVSTSECQKMLADTFAILFTTRAWHISRRRRRRGELYFYTYLSTAMRLLSGLVWTSHWS